MLRVQVLPRCRIFVIPCGDKLCVDVSLLVGEWYYDSTCMFETVHAWDLGLKVLLMKLQKIFSHRFLHGNSFDLISRNRLSCSCNALWRWTTGIIAHAKSQRQKRAYLNVDLRSLNIPSQYVS